MSDELQGQDLKTFYPIAVSRSFKGRVMQLRPPVRPQQRMLLCDLCPSGGLRIDFIICEDTKHLIVTYMTGLHPSARYKTTPEMLDFFQQPLYFAPLGFTPPALQLPGVKTPTLSMHMRVEIGLNYVVCNSDGRIVLSFYAPIEHQIESVRSSADGRFIIEYNNVKMLTPKPIPKTYWLQSCGMSFSYGDPQPWIDYENENGFPVYILYLAE